MRPVASEVLAGPVHSFPRLSSTVLDATDARGLAEFYRALLGLRYRPGDEPGADGTEDEADWLVLVDDEGRRVASFQGVDELPRSTWPTTEVPMQLHLCFIVDDPSDLEPHRLRAEELGATVLRRSEEPEEVLYVLADPAGHPFCLYTQP